MSDFTESASPRWPADTVPLEIFMLIVQHLDSRQELQSMRLVNQEFRAKLSPYYFRNVVVHVGPRFRTTLDTGLAEQHGTIEPMSIDNANRLVNSSPMFDRFTAEIRRFGLAFELDERSLATPDSVLWPFQVESRPWGLYRWPRSVTEISKCPEDITQALGNFKAMFHILYKLSHVQELALSCNGGLGYLHGPDINPLAPPQRLAVFGDAEPSKCGLYNVPIIEFDKSYGYEVLERGLLGNGVAKEDLASEMAKLAEREGETCETLAFERRSRCTPGDGWARRPDKRVCKCCESRSTTIRLQPDLLTETQLRTLIMHMSAHQALIQSYILAVMDNAGALVNLTKFNIASLPAAHLHLLCRDDVWFKLPALEAVSLAIIPDWREVWEVGPGTVNEVFVYPTEAVAKVYRLLKDHIGKLARIKRLHFEWVCGGEFAPGRLQRNNHILPAPFLADHRRVADAREDNLLCLPHVTHLSLKNCWFAPHVFFQAIRQMATVSLQSLELETVSLTGPPYNVDPGDGPPGPGAWAARNPPRPPPPPVLNATNTTALATFANIFAQLQGQRAPRNFLTGVTSYLQDPADWPLEVENPRPLSWPHIIDMLTPGVTIREHIYARDHLEPLQLKKKLKLQKLEFRSCGYVTIPDTRFISPKRFADLPRVNGTDTEPNNPDNYYNRRSIRCIRSFMQVNVDRHLARVVESIDWREAHALNEVFGLRFGWTNVYHNSIINAAKVDGIRRPGQGRFSGKIVDERGPTPLQRYNGIFYDYEDNEEQVEAFDTAVLPNDYDDQGPDFVPMLRKLEVDAGYIPGDRRPGRP
ncbi:hypothetical protein F5Y15DRAFT_419131 [Xylariaceae sp. FL0016]|nr:hypothetical protein F5Y15DRAFT_419131 [Xylariaceae sp. FL0016]